MDKNEKIALDREKKLALLQWLKQGYIVPADIPELYDVFDIYVITSRDEVWHDEDKDN